MYPLIAGNGEDSASVVDLLCSPTPDSERHPAEGTSATTLASGPSGGGAASPAQTYQILSPSPPDDVEPVMTIIASCVEFEAAPAPGVPHRLRQAFMFRPAVYRQAVAPLMVATSALTVLDGDAKTWVTMAGGADGAAVSTLLLDALPQLLHQVPQRIEHRPVSLALTAQLVVNDDGA